jgi:O-antigen biosynthesis protein WbqP
MKRVFDIVASLGGLLVFGVPILILIWLIRRDSEGPGLFVQQRMGREHRIFTCYKLRTMRADTVLAASHETPRSAVTPLGMTLRKWKLDELPQLWNVLRGEMSFVGPRPCLPMQHELIAEREAKGIFAQTPGITGLAQVQHIDMSDPRRLVAVEAQYLANHSFVGDLLLILRTVTGGGVGDRVAH